MFHLPSFPYITYLFIRKAILLVQNRMLLTLLNCFIKSEIAKKQNLIKFYTFSFDLKWELGYLWTLVVLLSRYFLKLVIFHYLGKLAGFPLMGLSLQFGFWTWVWGSELDFRFWIFHVSYKFPVCICDFSSEKIKVRIRCSTKHAHFLFQTSMVSNFKVYFKLNICFVHKNNTLRIL